MIRHNINIGNKCGYNDEHIILFAFIYAAYVLAIKIKQAMSI